MQQLPLPGPLGVPDWLTVFVDDTDEGDAVVGFVLVQVRAVEAADQIGIID